MMGAIVQAREGSGIGMTPEERAILKTRIDRIIERLAVLFPQIAKSEALEEWGRLNIVLDSLERQLRADKRDC
jgi:hypothetical protein